MALVKFIETTSDKLDSLPIVEGRFTFTTDGKFYLDAENASGAIERFSIHEDKILSNTTADWNSQSSLIAAKNSIYIYTDYQTTDDGDSIPGIKIGDGLAYLIDIPFVDTLMMEHMNDTDIHITSTERETWNSKVSVSLDPNNSSCLVFTTSE